MNREVLRRNLLNAIHQSKPTSSRLRLGLWVRVCEKIAAQALAGGFWPPWFRKTLRNIPDITRVFQNQFGAKSTPKTCAHIFSQTLSVLLLTTVSVGSGCTQQQDKPPGNDPAATTKPPVAAPQPTPTTDAAPAAAPEARPAAEADAVAKAPQNPETEQQPQTPPPVNLETGTAPWILAKAQDAHGGLTELAKLGRLTLTATGKNADGAEVVTQVRWAYPVTLHLTETSVGSTQVWGYDADGCWALRGPAVVGCDPLVDNTLGYSVQAIRHGSLLPPDPSQPVLMPQTVISGVECPTIQIGEVTLSFHPETYLLMALSNPGHRGEQGRFETTFSEWETVGGAKFPKGRITRFAGADICTETWTDIKIAGPEGVAANRPAQVEEGTIVHLTTEPVILATQTIKRAEFNLTDSVSQLAEFAGKHGLKRDIAPQFILTPIVGTGEPEVTLSIPLVSSVDVKSKRGDKFRIETLPPRHVIRIYHRGVIDGLDYKVSALADGLRAKNVTKVPKSQLKKVGHYDPAAAPTPHMVSYLELEVNEAPAPP